MILLVSAVIQDCREFGVSVKTEIWDCDSCEFGVWIDTLEVWKRRGVRDLGL
jgi:hypothetical protein